MISIISEWEKYFMNRHEGLGTTYERFILHQYFEVLKKRYAIESVIEVPCFGMTGISGINSLWWALGGVKTSMIDHNKERIALIRKVWEEIGAKTNIYYDSSEYTSFPFKDDTFDMGWNFAALWFVPKLAEFLHELTRVSKKVVFLCIPNRMNIFYRLRMISKKNIIGIYKKNINPIKIEKIMYRLKWRTQETGFFDIPPWPDIAMNKEDFLNNMGLKGFSERLKSKDGDEICVLDYFSGKKKGMEREILKYSLLENTPRFFKRFWAHHQYFIFKPI